MKAAVGIPENGILGKLHYLTIPLKRFRGLPKTQEIEG